MTEGEKGFETGEQWFERQSLEKQQKILGPQGFEAYYRGQVKLSDFIGHKHNDEWGGMYHTLPLKEALVKPGQTPPAKPPIKPIEPIKPAKPKAPRKTKPKPVATPQPLPQPPKPALKIDSVAGSFDLQVTGKLKTQVDHALEQIDQVHGVEGLPTIPLEKTSSKSYYGAYEHFLNGKAHAVKIKTGGPHVELTTCHEIGHFLDHQVLGTSGKFASFGPELADWRDAVEKSQSFKQLNDLLAQKFVNVTLETGATIGYPIKKSYVKYLLDKEELFARSYAQYIATRTKSSTLIAQVDGIRHKKTDPYHMQQWADADFEPIAQALDKIFADKGWLKIKP